MPGDFSNEDGNGALLGKSFDQRSEARDVIAMFVADQDGVHRVGAFAEGRQTAKSLAAAESGIHQQAGTLGGHQGAVAAAAAAEDGYAQAQVSTPTDAARS